MFFRVSIEVAYISNWLDRFSPNLCCRGGGLNLISSVTCHHWFTSYPFFHSLPKRGRVGKMSHAFSSQNKTHTLSRSITFRLFMSMIITFQCDLIVLCWRCLCKRTRLRSSNNRPTNHQSWSWKIVEVLGLQNVTNRSLNININII